MALKIATMEGEYGIYRLDDSVGFGLSVHFYNQNPDGFLTMTEDDWEACVAEIQKAVDIYRKQVREWEGDEE